MASNLTLLHQQYVADPGDQTDPNHPTLNALMAEVTRYATTLGRRGRHPSPEDLAQDIAGKVWRALSTFRGGSSFRTWVHGIAKRHLIDEARAAKRQPTPEQMDAPPESPSQSGTYRPNYSVQSLVGISEDDKAVLEMLINTGDFAYAAKQVGITPKALRSKLERIRKKTVAA